jgi:[acyl-carrier-protein] S-malonyltransferase
LSIKFSFSRFSYDLLRVCLEGPKPKLDKTIYSQPAIAVTSLASLEKLRGERPKAIDNCVATAGFSLGEITALIFAGSIPFDKGVKLIQVRAEAMQIASDENPSGMATVMYGPDSQLGLACLKAKEWCLERGVENPECAIANYLFPHCKVVAGNLEALNFLEKNAKQYKLRRVKRLPVSGGFHTKLMEPALQPFKDAMKKIRIEKPLVPVHSNVDGRIYHNVDQILRQLPKQIVKPVKWEQLMHNIYERPLGEKFPRTFECAPGHSLTNILKMVNAKAWDTCHTVEPRAVRNDEQRVERSDDQRDEIENKQ